MLDFVPEKSLKGFCMIKKECDRYSDRLPKADIQSAGSSSGGELEAEVERLRTRVSVLESMLSDRQEMAKTLQDQLRFLQTLIDTIPSPIFYKDKQRTYLGCNSAFERRLGLNRESILGKRAFDLFTPEIAARYEQHDAELLDNPGEKIYEASLIYPDGEKHDVIIIKGIFTDSEAEVAGLVGVIVDISERKRAQEALQRAHDDLEVRVERRTAALAEANRKLENEIAERVRIDEELRATSEKLKMFAYSVAHDLKSPSIGIHGLTRLLRKSLAGTMDQREEGICEQIMKASEHVASLVDAINIYIATKENPLRIDSVNVKEVFSMLRDEFSARLTVRSVTLAEPDIVPVIRADKISILRVFRNLIDNALKYGGERLTEIRIGYKKCDGFHHFSVRDNGVGIRTEDSAKVFDVFRREHGSEEIEGSGLGLAIIREIVELHRGRVILEANPEGGTLFHVWIADDL